LYTVNVDLCLADLLEPLIAKRPLEHHFEHSLQLLNCCLLGRIPYIVCIAINTMAGEVVGEG
jgi:hypothetical protein